MNRASKLAVIDALLPLLEAFGASRKTQTETRRAMRLTGCTARIAAESAFPCYHKTDGRTPWCEACRQHDLLFSKLMTERKGNKRRLLKIERLAVLYAEPEEPEPEEPKALLELIAQQEAAEGLE